VSSIVSAIRSLTVRNTSLRATSGQPLPFDDWVSMFNFGNFPLYLNQGYGGKEELLADSFAGLVHGAYKSNGIVFACELARIMLFSEARFQFRQLRSGRPGELFGTEALRPLEAPWRGGTTGDLLTRMLQDADFGGTGFVARRSQNRVRRMRPDWVTMVLGSQDDPDMTGDDIDADLIGLIYHPGGRHSDQRPVTLLAEDVAVFAPIPDPIARFRGIPWLTPIVREVMADSAATAHKLKFFENGATPQMIVSLDASIVDPTKFRQWVEVLEQDHRGVTNAYKTLYLGAGAKAEVVGANLQQLDFKKTQGAGETRIAAAAGVGPIVAMLSEGLEGSSLNQGNYAVAMRRVADLTMRPLWRNVAGSLANIIDVPSGSELWYDDRDIPALKDDIKDAAEVQSKEAQSIRTLLDAGWKPETVQDAIISGDWRRLEHSGLFSVQLQPPGSNPQVPEGDVAQALAALISHIQVTAERPAVPLLASGAPEPAAVRCSGCDKLLAEMASAPYRFTCPRCKVVNESNAVTAKRGVETIYDYDDDGRIKRTVELAS
jgi:phage FluMu protein Com